MLLYMTHTQLREAVKEALRNHDELKLSVMRGLLSNATNELVAKGKKPTEELPEDDIMNLIRRGAKQRKDSIEQFEKGNRADLAAKEKEELLILEEFLPAMLPRDAVEAAVRAKAAELGVTDKTKANQLISALMKDLKGTADGTVVKEIVDSLFA